jgi:putative transposase
MVTVREDYLANDHYYHIYSRSIAKYVVFNDGREFSRMIELIDLCRFKEFNYKFSRFKKLQLSTQLEIALLIKETGTPLVEIVAYCIMPTHIHFLLKQAAEDGVTKFMSKVLNSYSKSFNTSHARSGPLWSSGFKNIMVRSDEQLLHLTRYIHLNPTSAGLVNKPEDWIYSSYREYIDGDKFKNHICQNDGLFDISAKKYRQFVNDRKAYQRDLASIKSLLIDNYTG